MNGKIFIFHEVPFTFYSLFMDIQNSIFGYPKIDFRISINRAEYRISIIRFSNILKSIYGYPKIQTDFRISIILFLDILKSE